MEVDDKTNSNDSMILCNYPRSDTRNGDVAESKLNGACEKDTINDHHFNLSTEFIDPNNIFLLDDKRVDEIVEQAVSLRDRIENCVRQHYLRKLDEIIGVYDEEENSDVNGATDKELNDVDTQDQRDISIEPIKRTETISRIFTNDMMEEILQLESDLQGYIERSKSFSRSPRSPRKARRLSNSNQPSSPLFANGILQEQDLENGDNE
ncbi:hypothetical protein TrispH2_007300 [Trichoplax sp. H2]|nr:hypothetical protein TrispH2_007300 [Trichoplax sp. H2]|eukprot:RDD40699.1 hypothetical protein TrispH2_007300 [Trichoplax sp. H2]